MHLEHAIAARPGPAARVDVVTGWLRGAAAITVLTGAGISTDSGIPDFRGPQGLWTRNPAAQRMSSLADYLADPAIRRQAWRSRLEHPAWTAQPNAGHGALVDLERSGRLRALLTQNIDGLHQRAGSSPTSVIELHGTIHQVECLDCRDRQPMRAALDRVEAGEADPNCRHCGGILKSATVSFGQALDPAVISAADRAARSCEVFLAVGTSLTVHPVAGLAAVAAAAGAALVVINAQSTPYDELAAAVIREPIGEALPRLVAGLR